MSSQEYVAYAVKLVAGGLIIILLAVVQKVIHNVYFHPLAKYPGPLLAKTSDLWYALHWISGRYVHDIAQLHDQYGDVVRIAVNELSFSTLQSQKDIYGHAGKNKSQFLKSDWYSGPTAPGIASIRDPAHHREVRRKLSHAFSAAALRDQADIVQQYVEMFVAQLRRLGNDEKGIDVNSWYNWLTFDIIGDLAFGQSFGATETAQGHFWVDMIVDSSYAATLNGIFRRIPLSRFLALFLLDMKDLIIKFKKHSALTVELVKQRMANTKANQRIDFFSHLLKDNTASEDLEFFKSNAATLIVAGSETTATFLACATYYMLDNPKTLRYLTKEIRDSFNSSEEINADSTQKLEYLFAVCEEGLRIFPPAAFGLPRCSPGATIDGHYVPKNVVVSAGSWTLSRSERYFHDPHSFRPERWLPASHPLYDSKFANDQKEASKPFSSGPRVCIGINLAYLEMRLILTKMIYHFDLEMLSEDVDWNRDTKVELLWKKPELRIRFHDSGRV